MQNLRTHHFNDGKVITGLCNSGKFGAYLMEGEFRIRGYGHSRLAAIAELVEKIGADEETEEFDHQAARFDHARKLRAETV